MHRHVRRAAVPVLLALAARVPLLRAQETPEPLPSVRLDTLPVEVLRTPVSVRRAPYAVSVADGAEIRRAKPGLALDEALRAVPGVQVDNRFNYAVGERISVRGFGARAQFGVRGVRVMVDGFPATLPDGQTTLNHVDPGALGRAEVVRGPASALYGNASGGVIQLASPAPPAVPLAGEYRVVGGGDGLLRLQSEAGGRSGGFAYRAVATRLRYGGFREHSAATNEGVAAQLGHEDGGSTVRLVLNLARYRALNPGSLSDSLLRLDRRQAFGTNKAQDTGEEGRHGQAGVRWERVLGPGSLDLSAYGAARGLENPIPNRVIALHRRAGGVRAAYAAELPLGAAEVRWTAGAEAQAQRDDRQNYLNVEGRRGALQLDQLERVSALSGFVQAAAALGPRVELMGALRYDRHRFSVRDRLVSAADPDDSGARVMGAWSPTAGLSVAAAPALTLYANVATAFETPTTTELANRPSGAGGFNPELEPQRTLSYEAGAKGRLGDALAYTLAAYRARVRDALVPFEVEGAPGRQFFRNAGSAVHRGVEASLEASPVRGVSGRVAYTWTDARFGRYAVEAGDFGGKRVPGIAPHRVEATLLAEAPRGPFAGVDGRYVGAMEADDANRFSSPAYTVFDLRGGWRELRVGRMRATPYAGVLNLLDRAYNASVVVNAFGGRYFEPGPGRSFYLGMDVGLGGG
jgi:iron complex outermembrane receptor protein